MSYDNNWNHTQLNYVVIPKFKLVLMAGVFDQPRKNWRTLGLQISQYTMLGSFLVIVTLTI